MPASTILHTGTSAAIVRHLAAAPDAASLIARARLHGTLRAREDSTLDALLAEYRALRRRMTDPPAADVVVDAPADPPPGTHEAIDRALAAAAGAFGSERRRQRGLLREAQDHAMRGALNAIRLATLVQRQTGADTREIAERHALRLQALLDRDLAPDTDDRTLRPDDLPPSDLTHAARETVACWNAAGPDRQARCSADGPCMGRFDPGRVQEALTTLLDAAEARTGRHAAVTLALEHDPAAARLTVRAATTGDMDGRVDGADDAHPTQPLVRMLLRQIAASHRGRLEEAIDAPDPAFACRLTLGLEPLPEVPTPPTRAD